MILYHHGISGRPDPVSVVLRTLQTQQWDQRQDRIVCTTHSHAVTTNRLWPRDEWRAGAKTGLMRRA
jgi:hypothetical protein